MNRASPQPLSPNTVWAFTHVTTVQRRRHRSASPVYRFHKYLICHFSNTLLSSLSPNVSPKELRETVSRTRIRNASTAVAAAGLFSVVVALSPTAAADPATPTSPGVPGLDTVQQLAASAAGMAQSVQSAASAIAGVPATPATPAAPPPLASAAVTVPQAAAASALQNGSANAVPAGQVNLPTVPGLPVPLLDKFSLPGDLASLVRGGVPVPNLGVQPAAAAATPTSTAPGTAAGAAPAPTGLAALLPISALP